MKTSKLFIFLFLAVSIMGCNNNDDEIVQQLTDEQISLNLLNMEGIVGDIDTELLIGEWELVKFAYTANGNKIMDVAEKPYKSIFCISDYINELGVPTWGFSCMSEFRVEYLILPPNLINLSVFQVSYEWADAPEQDAIVSALNNAYSFVIKGNELIIYFTGDKNKNLLIFKKVKS